MRRQSWHTLSWKHRCGWLGVLCIVIVCVWIGSPPELAAAARLNTRQIQEEPLAVAVYPAEPFIIQEGDLFNGFSIELWREISRRADLSYEFVETATTDEQWQVLQTGDVDVALAVVMTAEREQYLDFSYPYYISGLKILTPVADDSLLRRLLSLFTMESLTVVGVFLLLLLLVAHVMWLVEHGREGDFSRNYSRGVWDALWWTVVTVSTVGYGDTTPRGYVGRLFAMIWIISGIFLIAHFTATLAAHSTAEELRSEITDFADLPGKRVATVEGTPSETYLLGQNIRPRLVQEIDDAFQLLEQGRVDAVVYVEPILHYYATTDGQGRVEVVGRSLTQEPYGMALPQESPYLETINHALLDIYADGTYQILYNKWFAQ